MTLSDRPEQLCSLSYVAYRNASERTHGFTLEVQSDKVAAGSVLAHFHEPLLRPLRGRKRGPLGGSHCAVWQHRIALRT